MIVFLITDSEVLQTMAVQCYTPVSSHLKDVPKFPSRKEEQTFDCFNVSVIYTLKCIHNYNSVLVFCTKNEDFDQIYLNTGSKS